MYFLFSPDNWVMDNRTGKEYLVIDTDTLDHQTNQQRCERIGGILPEPRDRGENRFLNNLNTDMFLFGMNDRLIEDHWVWGSDGTPVVWTNWRSGDTVGVTKTDGGWRHTDGGIWENCAVMTRNYDEKEPAKWEDLDCVAESLFKDIKKSLICQRNRGECDCLILYE